MFYLTAKTSLLHEYQFSVSFSVQARVLPQGFADDLSEAHSSPDSVLKVDIKRIK